MLLVVVVTCRKFLEVWKWMLLSPCSRMLDVLPPSAHYSSNSAVCLGLEERERWIFEAI